ncbi:MAG UNVERIFIED_CONTAM: hypothetical protein LVR18_25240 [Planctomycetaceae bacterium]|jgi:DNA repair exonuclease SbcCD ATPase subunit
MPPLTASNPAAQLAEQYAGEAAESLEKLKQAAESLQTDFGSQLTQAQNQLAAAEQRQQELTEDVQLAAADVREQPDMNAGSTTRQWRKRCSRPLRAFSRRPVRSRRQPSSSWRQQQRKPGSRLHSRKRLPQTLRPSRLSGIWKLLSRHLQLALAQIEQALNPLEQAAAAAEAAAAEAAVEPDPAGEPATGQQPADNSGGTTAGEATACGTATGGAAAVWAGTVRRTAGGSSAG